MGGWEEDGDAGEESGQEELGVDVSELDSDLFGTFQKDSRKGISACSSMIYYFLPPSYFIYSTYFSI